MPLPLIVCPSGVSHWDVPSSIADPSFRSERAEHRSRPERCFANAFGSVIVFERAGHDLGRAGGTGVRHDDHWQVRCDRSLGRTCRRS